jgi:signal transduction histidine kinase/ligand-binding sensor domain-containing protein
MHKVSASKILGPMILGLMIIVPTLAHYFVQDPSPTPSLSPAPSVSPSTSPTPTRRAPTPTPLPGAQNFHQWGSITVFNGLPSDSVRAIAQTPDGVMWFGTDNGLARFDGRRIQNFTPGGEGTERILALATNNDGILWVGTASGAFVYSNGRFEAVDNTDKIGITAILFASGPYLGTDAGMVYGVERQEGGPSVVRTLLAEPIRMNDGSAVRITDLVQSGDGLLAGTAGLGLFSIRSGAALHVSQANTPLIVNSLVLGSSDDLWIGTDAAKGASGIYHSIEPKPQRITAPTANVLSLEVNESGLWAGTERYGLFHITGNKVKKTYTFANTSGGLRSDNVFTLFTDREGVLWIGTNRGVSRFDRLGAAQESVSDIPNSNFIRTLCRLPKRDEFAGSNRGLFQKAGELWKKVPGFEEKAVYAISENDAGVLVGTSTGTYDLKGRLITAGDTRSIANFGDTYAAVIGRGVIDISSAKQGVIFSNGTATSLLAGRDRLWIGTDGNGLFSFDGKAVKEEVRPEALRSGAIRSMTSGIDQSLWIAGQHGVFRVMGGEIERIIEAEDVRDIYIDGNHIWAATTTRGLLHVRPDEGFGWLVTSIGFEQGLPSEKAFSIVQADGLRIATNRGIVTYRPGTVAPRLIPVRLLSQRSHDLSELGSSIALDFPQNSLLVEVAGQSSRTFPEEFQYAFVLKNGNGDEVIRQLSNDSQFAPADLKPGNYTIEAIAFNRDLLASDPLSITFSVAKAPFPWTATALGVLLLISLIALMWAVVEHRRIRQRNRELAAARLDLADEAERERRRIARDLHDQTLADLRNLMLVTDKQPGNNLGLRSEIEEISVGIRRICEDLSPSVLENVGLVPALNFLLGRSIENHSFSSSEHADELIRFPLNVQLHIYRIAQEVLTNIVRHSNADKVDMNVEVTGDDCFLLNIADNGGAFRPSASIGSGRGIANIRSRAAIIQANAFWKQRPGGGNLFLLELPMQD